MSKKKSTYTTSTDDGATDNPFAALGGLTNLPSGEGLGREETEDADEDDDGFDPAREKLYVSIDRKGRKGKPVTLIEGFSGSEERMDALAKALKTRVGAGGAVKSGNIEIQGKRRDKVIELLRELGYVKVIAKGG